MGARLAPPADEVVERLRDHRRGTGQPQTHTGDLRARPRASRARAREVLRIAAGPSNGPLRKMIEVMLALAGRGGRLSLARDGRLGPRAPMWSDRTNRTARARELARTSWLPGNRARRLRHRVPRRAGAPRSKAGRAEDHQARDGYQAGDRAIRGERQALALMGPPGDREGLRRRRYRGGAPVFRYGTGPRGVDHRLLRFTSDEGAREAGTLQVGLRGGAARPPARRHPPRHQAQQRARHAQRHRRRGRRSPRSSTSGSPRPWISG